MKRILFLILALIPLQCISMETVKPQKAKIDQGTVNKKFVKALIEQNEDKVTKFLNKGADPNLSIPFASGEEATPLGITIIQNNVPNAKNLIRHGANINTLVLYENLVKITPLELVVFLKGDSNLLRMLIEAGANLETRNLEGHTPLIRAAYNNDSTNVKELLRGGADVNAESQRSKKTSLVYAYEKLDLDLIELLLAFGADYKKLDKEKQLDLEIALNKINPSDDVIDFLLEASQNNSNVRIRQENFFFPALYYLILRFYSYFENTDQLIAFYENLKSHSQDILQTKAEAIYHLITIQIQKKFNIDAIYTDGYTALYRAFEFADVVLMQALWQAGCTEIRKGGSFKLLSIGNTRIDIRPSLDRNLRYVLDKLKNKNELSPKEYELYLFMVNFLLEQNKELVDCNLYQGNEAFAMTPMDFTKKYQLYEVESILQKYMTLKILARKKVISLLLQMDIHEQERQVTVLISDLLPSLKEEIENQLWLISQNYPLTPEENPEYTKLTTLLSW